MVLDDDLTVESVTHDVIDKLNLKMRGELKQRYKSNKNHIPRELLHKINSSQESFEMCQANKDG